MPVLPRAAEMLGGVVLLVDEQNVEWLCPMPGVRIVRSLFSDSPPSLNTGRTLRLEEFGEQEQAEFAAATGLPQHPNPLWSHLAAAPLASGASELPPNVDSLVKHVVCEASLAVDPMTKLVHVPSPLPCGSEAGSEAQEQ